MKRSAAVLSAICVISIFNQGFSSASEAFVYPSTMHGKTLSSGEIFRHDRLTAGHGSIPVGTVVRVTNVANRLGIDVLINDQWTGSTDGIILTRHAASMLRMQSGGSTEVTIEPLSHPVSRGITSATVPAFEQGKSNQPAVKGLYFLEFAAYKNPVQAKLLAGKLSRKGAPCKVVKDQQGLHHVISDGYFTSLQEASQAYHLVNDNVGYTPVIKQI